MFHFAYGSNMSPALMGSRCPSAEPLRAAILRNFQFLITRDGYASVSAAQGAVILGVLWRVTPRDVAALNLYESIDSALYRQHILPVRAQGVCKPALVYVGRTKKTGQPRPGYLELVIEASREWGLPADYIRRLEYWSVSAWRSTRAAETGEIA